MSGWAVGAGLVSAAVGAYGAHEQKKAAEAAAAGGQVQPWGNTGAMMDELLNDAWQQFKWGNFQFGPDPSVYNAYLDWGGNQLGLDTSGFQRIDPGAGYGFDAYQQMLNFIQGPAWQGRSQTNPAAMVGVQDPWAAAVLGGLGGFAGAGGFGGGGGQSSVTANQAALGQLYGQTGYSPTYMNLYQYQNPDPFTMGWGG